MEAPNRVQNTQKRRRQMSADAWNAAEQRLGIQLGIEHGDTALESADCGHLAQHDVDFQRHLGLKLPEVDVLPMQGAGLTWVL